MEYVSLCRQAGAHVFPHITLLNVKAPEVTYRSTALVSAWNISTGHVVFLGGFPFSPHIRLTRLKMSKIILTGRKTQIKKKVLFMILFDSTLCAVLEASVLMFQKLHTVRCRRKW